MNFLLEYSDYFGKQSRSVEISLDEAVKIYHQHCSDWDLKGNFLYRISKVNYQYATIDPKKFNRVSANTTNHYTVLIDDILESWKDYPQRSKSVIMSGDSHVHLGSKMMIPFNNSKIAMAPRVDLWWSFHISDLNTLNDKFLSRLKLNGVYLGDMIVKKDLKVNEYLNNYYYSDFLLNFEQDKSDFIKNINKYWGKVPLLNLYQLLNDDLLNPEVNNFKIMSSEEFQKITFNDDKECWSNDPFLVINNQRGDYNPWEVFKESILFG